MKKNENLKVVVFCKHCEYGDFDGENKVFCRYEEEVIFRNAKDFCSRGERKEDE